MNALKSPTTYVVTTKGGTAVEILAYGVNGEALVKPRGGGHAWWAPMSLLTVTEVTRPLKAHLAKRDGDLRTALKWFGK